MKPLRLFAVALLLCVVVALKAAADERLQVCASFSIIGDIVAQIGGDDIRLTVLVGAEADAHEFQVSAQHARAVSSAALLVMNGRGFDDWAERLHKSTGSKSKLLRLTDNITTRLGDPHIWQDVGTVLAVVDKVAINLAQLSPGKKTKFLMRAANYKVQLSSLHATIKGELAAIPEARRRVITSHDSFGYFGNAYGIQFMAPLGISTHAQPSAKAVAKLITQIRREKISALFVENISDPRLLNQIARETSVKIGGKLYSDALSGVNGPASNYVAMMRHNAKLLTAAMRQGS